MRRIITLAAMILLAACGSDFHLFDASAPVLDARFALDSAGAGTLPYTSYDNQGLSGIKMMADTLVFAPDGQVTRRWTAFFLVMNGGHWDSSFAATETTWNGQYDLRASRVQTWLADGNPAHVPDTLTLVGDSVLVASGDFVTHARMHYRRVSP